MYVLFPGALGDFLCFAESLRGLRRRHPGGVTIIARPSWTCLLDARPFPSASIDGSAIAELFGAAPLDAALRVLADAAAIYSFTGAGDPSFARQLGSLAPRVQIFPFRDFRPGEHASDYYARCLEVTADPVEIRISAAARSWAREVTSSLRSPLLTVHPGSGSRRKNWDGFAEVARDWRRRGGSVIELQGPAEQGGSPLPDADLVVREELPRVAALLEATPRYLGNDSGITHLGAAVGVRGLALFGVGGNAHWRPRSAALEVVEATKSCSSCAALCTHQLSIGDVIQRLQRLAICATEVPPRLTSGSSGSRTSSAR